MTATMSGLLRPALVLFLLLSALTGLAYPAVVAGLGAALFPRQAAGSLLGPEGHPVGAALIGQSFSDAGHFWGRPSATSPQPYNGLASGGSNLGPSNPALADAVRSRVQALREADPGNAAPIPADLVTASASGLDPDISPQAARYQVARVARARGLPPPVVSALVERQVRDRQWGLFGEPRINVLALNLELESLH